MRQLFSLLILLSALLVSSCNLKSTVRKKNIQNNKQVLDSQGAIIRMNPSNKEIYLIFSADEHGEGAPYILDVLRSKKIKASFFLTGKFLRNEQFKPYIKRMIQDGHYTGAHSDQHLLYNSWENRDSLLVDQKTFELDLKNNYKELSDAGINTKNIIYYLPPYEWYNSDIVNWSEQMGINVINFTPGTGTNADYTTPDMKNYKSSEEILNRMMDFEQKEGLNGAIILIHLGTHMKRTDKFYYQLNTIIEQLTVKGYIFKSF